MCCIMKLFREIIFLPAKLMFSHKNIKLFGHLALLKGGVLVKKKCYSGLLIKYDVTWAVLLSSVTFTHCTKLLFLWPFLIVMITFLGSELGDFEAGYFHSSWSSDWYR